MGQRLHSCPRLDCVEARALQPVSVHYGCFGKREGWGLPGFCFHVVAWLFTMVLIHTQTWSQYASWPHLEATVSAKVCSSKVASYCLLTSSSMVALDSLSMMSCERWGLTSHGFHISKGFQGMACFHRAICFHGAFTFHTRALQPPRMHI